MDRVNLTSLSLALLFLCIALLVHTSCSTEIGESGDEMRARVKKAAPAADNADGGKDEGKKATISDNPYDRPNNFKLDMYRLLAIALFVGFAIVMYFVVWRFCSGPPA